MAGKSYWDEDLDEFNPYYGQFYNKDGTKVSKNKEKDNEAKDTLRNSEQSALSNEKSFFTGTGKSSKQEKTKNLKGLKLKGKKKGFSVIFLIVTILGCVFSATLLNPHSLLVPALNTLITESTDTQYGSYTKRVSVLTNYMLEKNDPTKITWRGGKKYARISTKMRTRLKQQGITVENKGSKAIMKFNGDTITAEDFGSRFKNDVEFRDAYLKAKHGRIANFFDKMATKIFDHFGITRNLWYKYEPDSDPQKAKAEFEETMKSQFEDDENTTITKSREEVEEDGETTSRDVIDSEEKTKTGSDIGEAHTKAESFLNNTAKKVKKVTTGTSITCMLLRVGSLISIATAGLETFQSIRNFMSEMENPSKTMAGDGDESAIMEFLNLLTTTVTAKVVDVGDFKINATDKEITSSGSTNEVEITGAPLEANGLQMMLSNAPANAQTNARYSYESTINSFAKALSMDSATVTACSVAQATTAVISIAVNVLTLGTATIAELAWDIAKSAAINIVASTIMSFAIPRIAQYLFSNPFESVIGIPSGEFLARGGATTNTRLARSGSAQSPSSETAALAYSQVNQEAIAMEAETDRLNRSPFDISSKNTFLGSIAYSLLPLTLNQSTTSTISSVNTFTRLTSNSLASLTGSVSAKGKNSTFMTTFGECPQLDSIGAVGDIYCNPVTSTDPDLLNLDPEDEEYIKTIKGNLTCDEDGNCEINDDSELVKYIVYCANRDSPFGVIDANILGSLQPGNGNDATSKVKTVLGWVPFLGDAIDIIDATSDVENVGWADGSKCVNSKDNKDWKEFKYYQRYYEDQRILEQMGQYDDDGGKSPITSFLEKYEEAHPVDNSRAGIIARFSGITKDDAETVLAIVEYTQFLENYHPEDRIAMDGDTTDYKTGEEIALEIQNQHFRFESGDIVKPESTSINSTIAKQYIIYADIRNRSYTTA